MGVFKLIQGNTREVKDVLYLLALQGVNFVAPLLVLPYLMKVLGAERFGYIGFSLAACQYLQLIVDFGFNLSATKRIAVVRDDPAAVNRVFSSTFYAKMFLLAVSAVLLVLVSLIPRFELYRSTLYLFFLSVVGNAFLFVFLFQGIGQVKWVSIGNAVSKFALLPLTFWLVKSPDDVLTAAALQALVSVGAALFTIVLTWRRHWVRLLPPDWTEVKNEMRESWPIFLSSAATNVYTACFVLILAWYALPEEVGRYSAVDRVMRALCYAALMPVLQAFYPKISRLAAVSRAEALQLGRQLSVVVVTAMLLVGAALFFGGPWVEYWLGGNYAGTGRLFHIDAFVPLFVGLGGVYGQLFLLALGGGREKRRFQNTYLLAAAVALVSVVLLSPRLGSVGTALSLLLTEAVVAICFIFWTYRMRHGV